jgi:hypothetical protein
MGFLYILRSDSTGRYYVGSTGAGALSLRVQ